MRSGFPETFCSAAALTIWMGAALPRAREHHHPEFDVDESTLAKGAAALAAIAIEALQKVTA